MSTELATGVAVAVMVLANGVVGWSLMRTALRTRRAPELMIGIGLFAMGPLSQGLTAFAGTGRLPAGDVNLLLHALACLGSGVGMSCVYGFVLMVFRPGVPWARALTALAVITLVMANVASIAGIATAAPETPSQEAVHGSGLAIIGGFTLAFGWAAFESGSYWLRARKQLRLGLIDAVVADRFLLWAIASCAAFLLGVFLLASHLERQPLVGSLAPSLAIMGASLVTATTMYLAFLPPRSYLAWVERRAGAAS